MSACERCWGDAFVRQLGMAMCQSTAYRQILEERKENPCTPREQAGQWWCEAHEHDTRRSPCPLSPPVQSKVDAP